MEKLLKQILWVMTIALLVGASIAYICLTSKVDVVEESLGGTTINKFYTVDTSATTTVAGVAKVVLLPSTSRKYAVITNTSATIAYLAFNGTSTLTSIADSEYVIPLTASGGTYTINLDNLYRGQVVASSSGVVTVRSLDAN